MRRITIIITITITIIYSERHYYGDNKIKIEIMINIFCFYLFFGKIVERDSDHGSLAL